MQSTNLAIIAQKQPVAQQTKTKSSVNNSQFSFMEVVKHMASSQLVMPAGIKLGGLDFSKYRFQEQDEPGDEKWFDTPYDLIAEIRKILRQGKQVSNPLVKGLEEIK